MKKIYLFAIISFSLGIGCLVAFKIIGSEITADGTLVEPFALIPIGWLLITAGIILGFIFSVWSFFHKK